MKNPPETPSGADAPNAEISPDKPATAPGARPRMGRKARETREKLLTGALAALCAEGVTGITTRKIAEFAQVNLGTLHYHFESKDALLLAVLDYLGANMDRSLRMGVAGSRNLDECIGRALLADWRHAEDDLTIQIVQYELTLYALRSADARWMARRQYNDYIRAHVDAFALHVDAEDPETMRNVERLAQLVMAGIDGIILQELASPDMARSRVSVDDLIHAMRADARKLGLIQTPDAT
ncbi:TetR/AcrR family transcriptional regulator [Salipiger abyssi]|uniref:TetR/AcrR family transcriptional regulator n=1 Tax=Salipiger abyssi TaxID=1250539 RepID=UPI001A8D5F1D|nr:TetR/AcrR family transcriptional regulator [Salipiger abyssi]MBN9887087.1 TetR/AcrR family transcriptional regulator [Salipiger abyssi]